MLDGSVLRRITNHIFVFFFAEQVAQRHEHRNRAGWHLNSKKGFCELRTDKDAHLLLNVKMSEMPEFQSHKPACICPTVPLS